VATEIQLRDGSVGMVWALLPEDRKELARAYQRLTPGSKYHRFLTGVPHLSEAMLDRLVDGVDGIDHMALVLLLFDEQGLATPVGIGRLVRYDDDPHAADVAVTVAEGFRGRGVASALLAAMVAERPAGLERLRTTVAVDNPASLAMLRRLGPTTVEEGEEGLDVEVSLVTSARSVSEGGLEPPPPFGD
jgi:RimJ/RimL family protein N-acetyltransferase